MTEPTQEEIDAAHARADKKNFALEIVHRADMTAADVYYLRRKTGEQLGYGYISKKDNPEEKISLVRCPACRLENYYSNVSSGRCTWCPFNANGENE